MKKNIIIIIAIIIIIIMITIVIIINNLTLLAVSPIWFRGPRLWIKKFRRSWLLSKNKYKYKMHELLIGKKIKKIKNKIKVVVGTTADKIWDLCGEHRSLFKLTSKYWKK